MKLAAVTIWLFLIMKCVYNIFGDSSDVLWRFVFYVPLYLMITALIRFMYLNTTGYLKRFLVVVMFYFLALILVYVICLFVPRMYSGLIINLNTFGIPAIVLAGGLVALKIQPLLNKLSRSHDK